MATQEAKLVFPTPAVPMITSSMISTLLKAGSIEKMKVVPEMIEKRHLLMVRQQAKPPNIVQVYISTAEEKICKNKTFIHQ